MLLFGMCVCVCVSVFATSFNRKLLKWTLPIAWSQSKNGQRCEINKMAAQNNRNITQWDKERVDWVGEMVVVVVNDSCGIGWSPWKRVPSEHTKTKWYGKCISKPLFFCTIIVFLFPLSALHSLLCFLHTQTWMFVDDEATWTEICMFSWKETNLQSSRSHLKSKVGSDEMLILFFF